MVDQEQPSVNSKVSDPFLGREEQWYSTLIPRSIRSFRFNGEDMEITVPTRLVVKARSLVEAKNALYSNCSFLLKRLNMLKAKDITKGIGTGEPYIVIYPGRQ